jgi:DNA-binding phage protein
MKTTTLNEIFKDDLSDPNFIADYLQIALEENGVEGFFLALSRVIQVNANSKEILSGQENLAQNLSEKNHPQFTTILNILETMGVGLNFIPLKNDY